MPLSSNKSCNRTRQVLAGCCITLCIGLPVPVAAGDSIATAPAALSAFPIGEPAVTPVPGSPAGERLIAPTRERVKPGERDGTDKASFVSDPVGENKAEGSRSPGRRTLHWRPIVTETPVLASGAGSPDEDSPEAARSSLPTWGLQISVDW